MELFDGNVKHIFVGRSDDLGELQKQLDEIKEANEAKQVFTVLNVPGIGKTELIKHFGEALQNKTPFTYNSKNPLVEKALFFHYTIEMDDTRNTVYKEIVDGLCKAFYTMFNDKVDELPTIYSNAINSYKETNSPKKFVEILTEGEYNQAISKPKSFMGKLTDKIPIILHLDEFQKSIPHNREEIDPNNQLYYQLSSFFSGILNKPIFIILTGTQYTIISTIGDNLGSPLNGKVEPIVIPFLKEEDMEEFADRIIIKTENTQEEKIKEVYLKWLKFMSRGHPRTMEYMTKQFLWKFKSLNTQGFHDWKESKIEKTFKEINILTEKTLRRGHLRTAAMNALKEIINESPIPLVNYIFEYLGTRMMIEENLGDLETDISREFGEEKNEILTPLNKILSKFVEVGLFSRNGGDNFYISSMYAFKYFTEIFRKKVPLLADAFNELLNEETLFTFIRENPSVYGFFWEPIFATILTKALGAGGKESNKIITLPNDIVDVYGALTFPQLNKPIEIINIKESQVVDIAYLQQIKPRILYLLPRSTGVDGVLLYENTVFILQIKNSPSSSYVKTGLNAILKAAEELEESEYAIIPWLIDVLGALKPEMLENKSLLYTTKEQLSEFLPKRLN